MDVYKRLIDLSADLEALAEQAVSVAGEAALRTCARLVRACASGFFMTLGADRPEPPSSEL